jgi:hypothetical protein
MLENTENASSKSSCETGPLGYLVCTPKALPILLTHKIRDARLQYLLAQSACILLAFSGVGICGFFLIPIFWAVGAFASAIFLLALFISIGTGDLFLQFALEDNEFFEMATESNALSVFEDQDQSLPQPSR